MTARRAISVMLAALLAATLAAPALGGDLDRDGLRDRFETRYGLTSPDDPDSDGDGVVDAAEDPDGDRLGNLGEQRFRTNPAEPDTDGDGRRDGAEDADGDGRSNARQQDQRRVPRGLRPSLRAAEDDVQPLREQCQSLHGQSRVISCSFGDPTGSIEIVLAGDSHATMYLTPLKRIAKQRGWHLRTMAKSACPALAGLMGNNQWERDRGRDCRLWQQRVISRLNRSPVDLVIYAHTPGYKLRKRNGSVVAPWKRSGQWRTALKRTVRALPKETTVLALGGTPRNFGRNPVNCLLDHRGDISACATARQPFERRSMDVGLQQASTITRAVYDTLYDQVCTYDPCPLVQGDILVWRDGSHLSDTFAKRLQPSLERILDDALAASGAGT